MKQYNKEKNEAERYNYCQVVEDNTNIVLDHILAITELYESKLFVTKRTR